MKRLLFVLILLLISLNCFGKERKIVLLTSLMETDSISRSHNAKLETSLEKLFQRSFHQENLHLVTHHLTDPQELWRYLNDEEVLALLWVSHAKKGTAVGSFATDSATVMDAFGNDVKNLFRRTTNDLKFLGIVGCEAEELLVKYKNEGLYRDELVLKSFSKKVYAKTGLKEAIKILKQVLRNDSIDAEEVEETYQSLELKVLGPSLYSGQVKIELNNEVLAIVSASEMITINVPDKIWKRAKNRNIKLSALRPRSSARLPIYEINIDGEYGDWKVFGKDGVPVGQDQNLYLWQPY